MRLEVPLVLLGLGGLVVGCSPAPTETRPTLIPSQIPVPTLTRNPARISSETSLVTRIFLQDKLTAKCRETGDEGVSDYELMFLREVYPLTTNWSVEKTEDGLVLEQETSPFDKVHLAPDGRRGLREVSLQEGGGPRMSLTPLTPNSFVVTMKCR